MTQPYEPPLPCGKITEDTWQSLKPVVKSGYREHLRQKHATPTWHQPDPAHRELIGMRHVGWQPGNGTLYRVQAHWLHPDITARVGGPVMVLVSDFHGTWTGRPLQAGGFLHSTYLEDKFRELTAKVADWVWQAWLITYVLARESDVDAVWIARRLTPVGDGFDRLPAEAQAAALTATGVTR